MKISWLINKNDIKKIQDFINDNDNPFVQKRIERNINRYNIILDKDSLILNLVMCLLTTQQRSGPNTPVGRFLQKKPFPITIQSILKTSNLKVLIENILKQNGLNRFISKISQAFEHNIKIFRSNNWEIITLFETRLNGEHTKTDEREIADYIDDLLMGFGPKQSRNFLQGLGLTKYEIPIDSRITNWLNNFGFPITLNSNALQDKGYYHFVSDGIQNLCAQAKIYPCILDAAIFSSFDKGEWTNDNLIY